jgi:hypothetical protein
VSQQQCPNEGGRPSPWRPSLLLPGFQIVHIDRRTRAACPPCPIERVQHTVPSNHPGWASSHLGLFRRSHKSCASKASSCTYSGCAIRLRWVSGERSEYQGPVSGRTVALASHRHVTTTAAPYQSDTPRLARSSCSSSAANHPRANSRTGMFTLSGGIPSRCERRNRTHQGSHAHTTTVQHTAAARPPLRPMLAEPTQPRRQWRLAAIEHPDVPVIRPRLVRLR